ncbi:MAG: hypothetical protein N3F09_08835 [Bacteroidia bacterium]|nr:hypothetical protein [Bacteroidia bacterium]
MKKWSNFTTILLFHYLFPSGILNSTNFFNYKTPDSLFFFNLDTFNLLIKSDKSNLKYLNDIEKYLYFNSTNDENKIFLIYKKIYIHLSLNTSYFAASELKRLRSNFYNLNKLHLYYYNMSLIYYLMKKFDLSLHYLDSTKSHNYNKIENKVLLLKALVYLELFEYENSKNCLIEILDKNLCQKNNVKLRIKVDSVYKNIRKKNLKKARILSFIIPGSGYAYLNHPAAFFISFSLFGSSMVYFVFNIIHKCYFTISTINLFLIKTSYLSGINGLNTTYSEKHLKKLENTNKNIKKFILNNF